MIGVASVMYRSAPASALLLVATRPEAIELARQAAPHAADYPEVTVAEAGPFGPLIGCDTFDLDIDYLDGRTYGVFNFRG